MMDVTAAITSIQDDMSPLLSMDQLARLGDVLRFRLCENKTEISVPDPISLFIGAKKIEGLSEKTLWYYEWTARLVMSAINKDIRAITTDDVRRVFSDYQMNHKISKISLDNMRRNLSSFFGWLENENYILRSPMRRIAKIKTEKIIKETISDEEMENLRKACRDRRDRAILEFLFSTGVRISELIGLDRDSINFHERECVVFGKGGKERAVYFDAGTKIHLMDYLDSRKDKNPALFVGLYKPHNRLLAEAIEQAVRRLGKTAGVRRIHPHKFRRTMATVAIDKGMPIEQVQRLLGHEQIETTMRYAMVNQANVKNAHRKYIG
jgi:site-specific recombinase XerD